MTSPKAYIESISITADSHVYDGNVDGIKFHFIDTDGDQTVNTNDSLDFFFQLSQYNYPTCEDILNNTSFEASSKECKKNKPKSPECTVNAAINTCNKMTKIEYKMAIEGATKLFQSTLEKELSKLKKSVSKSKLDSTESNLCEVDYEESTFIKKDGIQITDIDSSESADEVVFTTTDGISVYISAVADSCHSACCKVVDTTRVGVAKYLSILDPLFDYSYGN